MTENETKKQPNKDKKRMDISAIAMIDNIVLSKTDAWAYFRIENKAFDFLSHEGKIAMAQKTTNAFANIMSDRKDSLDCHLIMTSTPVDVDSWEEQVREVSSIWKVGPGFDEYVKSQVAYLKYEEFLKKVTYFGVHLGKRGALNFDDLNPFERGFKGAFEFLKKWWNNALMVPNEEVSVSEEKDWRDREKEFYRLLSTGNLQATRASSEELLLLIKRQFYPAMNAPYLDVDHGNRLGAGDLVLEASSVVKNKYRWLTINQQIDEYEYEGYRACLSFSKFPKKTFYPNGTIPFFYFPSKLMLPFTLYSRFTLHPSANMKKRLEKKRLEQKDELENISVGANAIDSAVGGTPTDVIDSLEASQLMGDKLARENTPWVEGSYRIVVETPDEETLRKYCSIVKNKYADLDIVVNWSAGDQSELFLEQMPGDRERVKSFRQITDLQMLGTSGFNFSSDVGDPIFGSDGEVNLE